MKGSTVEGLKTVGGRTEVRDSKERRGRWGFGGWAVAGRPRRRWRRSWEHAERLGTEAYGEVEEMVWTVLTACRKSFIHRPMLTVISSIRCMPFICICHLSEWPSSAYSVRPVSSKCTSMTL